MRTCPEVFTKKLSLVCSPLGDVLQQHDKVVEGRAGHRRVVIGVVGRRAGRSSVRVFWRDIGGIGHGWTLRVSQESVGGDLVAKKRGKEGSKEAREKAESSLGQKKSVTSCEQEEVTAHQPLDWITTDDCTPPHCTPLSLPTKGTFHG